MIGAWETGAGMMVSRSFSGRGRHLIVEIPSMVTADQALCNGLRRRPFRARADVRGPSLLSRKRERRDQRSGRKLMDARPGSNWRIDADGQQSDL